VVNLLCANRKEVIIVQVEGQAKVQGVQTRATLVDKSVERLTASPVIDQEGFQGAAMVSSKEEHAVGDRAASTELQRE
jgi:hypothetical protein